MEFATYGAGGPQSHLEPLDQGGASKFMTYTAPLRRSYAHIPLPKPGRGFEIFDLYLAIAPHRPYAPYPESCFGQALEDGLAHG